VEPAGCRASKRGVSEQGVDDRAKQLSGLVRYGPVAGSALLQEARVDLPPHSETVAVSLDLWCRLTRHFGTSDFVLALSLYFAASATIFGSGVQSISVAISIREPGDDIFEPRVNLVPLAIEISRDASFQEVVDATLDEIVSIMRHRYLSYEALLARIAETEPNLQVALRSTFTYVPDATTSNIISFDGRSVVGSDSPELVTASCCAVSFVKQTSCVQYEVQHRYGSLEVALALAEIPKLLDRILRYGPGVELHQSPEVPAS
jgi:hypothetical protein